VLVVPSGADESAIHQEAAVVFCWPAMSSRHRSRSGPGSGPGRAPVRLCRRGHGATLALTLPDPMAELLSTTFAGHLILAGILYGGPAQCPPGAVVNYLRDAATPSPRRSRSPHRGVSAVDEVGADGGLVESVAVGVLGVDA
jgi:hypothetical protein